jgi:hypothetical protein
LKKRLETVGAAIFFGIIVLESMLEVVKNSWAECNRAALAGQYVIEGARRHHGVAARSIQSESS